MRARLRAIERALHAKRPRSDEHASIGSYQKRLERQCALAGWLWDQEFDLKVTLNSNDIGFDYERGSEAIRKLGAFIDRCLLGKDWWAFKSRERTFFFAVPEHAGGELHYHVLLKLPPAARSNPHRLGKLRHRLTENLRKKRIFPHGDAHVEPLSGGAEIDNWLPQFKIACYVVKGLWHQEEWDNCIVSTQFHPEK